MSRKATSRPPYEIGGVRVQPGSRAEVQLPVAQLYTQAPTYLTVQVVHGRQPGPCIFISAALHGDELNGVEIIRRLLLLPAMKRLRGTLLAIPIVNVLGFLQRSRYFPDRRDLNRSFPGTPNGSMAAQTAHLFMEEIIARSDCGIDLHTAAIHRKNLPQTRGKAGDAFLDDMASAFDAPVHLRVPLRQGSMRAAADAAGTPVLLFEAGEALRLDEPSIKMGVNGVIRVLRHLGMLPGKINYRAACNEWCAAGKTRWLRAATSGLFRSARRKGFHVKPGDVLGRIADPLGQTEKEIVSPWEGVIIGQNSLAVVHQGDALFHVALLPESEALAESLESFQDELDEEFF